MRIQYLVDRELDVISGGQDIGGGGVDVAELLAELIRTSLPEVAGAAITEHVPFI